MGEFIVMRGRLMDKIGLESVLLHRQQALCLDGVIAFNEEERTLSAARLLLPNDQEFAGHFPNWPIFPGHWMLESCLLTAGVLYFGLFGQIDGKPVPCLVDGIKFLRPGLPGDVLVFTARYEGTESIKGIKELHCFSASVRNQNGKKVCQIGKAACSII
jgi:3-hydroxymyristoyl/3-hydroxydecanoyl-(acyl carrier protein) dehydratase